MKLHGVFKNAFSFENRFYLFPHELLLDAGARKSIIYTSYRTPHKHLVNIPKYRQLTGDTCSVFKVREQAPGTRESVQKPLAQRRAAKQPLCQRNRAARRAHRAGSRMFRSALT
jgi:hypothetical protein